jgi:hypothetical protein
MREQLIREVEIIPLEVICRNVAAGSLSKRLGIEEGTPLPQVANEILSVIEERGKARPAIAAELGLSRNETQRYSLFRAIRALKFGAQEARFKEEAAFEIERGDLTIHDGRLWHRVEVSPNVGEKSRRRVMYVPIITGKYKPKNDNSKTPFYHRFTKVVTK